jgi:hypothetical protein
LPTIWREAAAHTEHAGVRQTAFADLTTAAQPIADKSGSYALRAESKATPFGPNQKLRPSGRIKNHALRAESKTMPFGQNQNHALRQNQKLRPPGRIKNHALRAEPKTKSGSCALRADAECANNKKTAWQSLTRRSF